MIQPAVLADQAPNGLGVDSSPLPATLEGVWTQPWQEACKGVLSSWRWCKCMEHRSLILKHTRQEIKFKNPGLSSKVVKEPHLLKYSGNSILRVSMSTHPSPPCLQNQDTERSPVASTVLSASSPSHYFYSCLDPTGKDKSGCERIQTAALPSRKKS